jgi:hypothetical protein
MSLFLGNTGVGISTIEYKSIPKFGVLIDNIIGNVSNGTLQAPSETFSFRSNEILSAGENALKGTFAYNAGLVQVSLPLMTSGDMKDTFRGCANLTTVDLEKYSSGTLDGTFAGCTSLSVRKFTGATNVPTYVARTFANTNNNFVIVVPDSLYNDWVSGWGEVSSHIRMASDYIAVMTNHGGYASMDN